jgi:hypothetical protein
MSKIRISAGWVRFQVGTAQFLQELASITMRAEAEGDDLLIAVEAVSTEKVAEDIHARGNFADLAIAERLVRANVRVAYANRCVIFGAEPNQDGRRPNRESGGLDKSHNAVLSAAATLAGAGAIYGRLATGQQRVVHCWQNRDAPLQIVHLHTEVERTAYMILVRSFMMWFASTFHCEMSSIGSPNQFALRKGGPIS